MHRITSIRGITGNLDDKHARALDDQARKSDSIAPHDDPVSLVTLIRKLHRLQDKSM